MKRTGGGKLGDSGGEDKKRKGKGKGKGKSKSSEIITTTTTTTTTTTDSNPPPPEGGESIINIDDVKKDDSSKIKGPKKGYNPYLDQLSAPQLEHLYNKVKINSKGDEWKRIHNDIDPDDPDYHNDEFHCYLSATNVNKKKEEDKWGYPKNIRLGTRQQLREGDLIYDSNSSWSAAQLVLFRNGRRPDFETYPDPKQWEASHLCNHPWCVNLDHLVWEHILNNTARKNCRTWITCPCGCNHSFNPCIHEPKCITMKACKCTYHSKIII
jgi:hypothetical protein